jgi:DNA-binding transcriptional regulator GbsR (MarR family)
MVKNDKNLSDALDIFIQGAGQVSSALLGMVNKVGGQIYALLFLSDEPLSLDEIAEKLEISKGNISINIRMLEETRLVRKVWIKGSRKDYYSAERVYPKKVIKGFLEKIQRNIQDAITTIEETRSTILEINSALKSSEKEKAEFMLNQLTLIGSFYYGALHFFNDFFDGKPIDIDILRHLILNPENLKNPAG